MRRYLIPVLVLLAAPAAVIASTGPDAFPHHSRIHAPTSAEEVRDRLGRVAERALDRVDATEAQRAEIEAVLDGLAPQLWEGRKAARALRADLRDALTADRVDRAALEDVRQDFLQLADEGTAVGFDALADMAEVLTPEQRQELSREIGRMLDR